MRRKTRHSLCDILAAFQRNRCALYSASRVKPAQLIAADNLTGVFFKPVSVHLIQPCLRFTLQVLFVHYQNPSHQILWAMVAYILIYVLLLGLQPATAIPAAETKNSSSLDSSTRSL